LLFTSSTSVCHTSVTRLPGDTSVRLVLPLSSSPPSCGVTWNSAGCPHLGVIVAIHSPFVGCSGRSILNVVFNDGGLTSPGPVGNVACTSEKWRSK
jgi:hypothetical protein